MSEHYLFVIERSQVLHFAANYRSLTSFGMTKSLVFWIGNKFYRSVSKTHPLRISKLEVLNGNNDSP
jgi:hypothetical protein